MNPVATSIGKRWAWIGLTILLLTAAGLRLRGTEWPLLHPDEYKIDRWAAWIEDHTRTEDPIYPGGFFHLIKPVLAIKNAVTGAEQAWSVFVGHGKTPPEERGTRIFLLRKINAIVAVLTVWLLYLLATRLTGNRAAGLAAAAFLAFSRLHVEHSHYAETDIAMLFTLTLALYLWLRVGELGQLRWLLAAALATGVAIGTKYTNAVLLVNVIVGVTGVVRTRVGRDWLSRWGLPLGVAVGLLLLGVVFANRHVLEIGDTWSLLQHRWQAVYAERQGLMGKAGVDMVRVLLSNWDTFAEQVLAIDWLWWPVMVLGLGVSLARPYRRYWPVTVLFGGVYLFYFLRLAPWVRGQEFLALLPVFGMFIAIGVVTLAGWARRCPRPAMAAGVLAVFVAVAAGRDGISSARFASLCGRTEPRVRAMNWLYHHAPLGAWTGTEDYTVPACRLFWNAVNVGQIEWVDAAKERAFNLEYLVRNATAQGRGTVDPKTRDLYPDYAANLARFQNTSALLCEWGSSAPDWAFVGNRMEWWEANPPVNPVLRLALPLFRPVRIDTAKDVDVTMVPAGLGCWQGMWVDPERRTFTVSGAAASRRTLYAVLQTEERHADVVVSGMGTRQTVAMPPYTTAVVPVRRAWFMPRLSEYDIVSISAVPKTHVVRLPCYAQLAVSPLNVATLLFQKGYPDRALEWLNTSPEASVADSWLRYACDVEQGDWAAADRSAASAASCLAQLESARALASGQVQVNGFGETAYCDHARLRMPDPAPQRDGVTLVVPPLSVEITKEDDTNVFSGRLPLPVRLAPGEYTLRATLKLRQALDVEYRWPLTVSDNLQAGSQSLLMNSLQECQLVRRFSVDRERSVSLDFVSPTRGGSLEVTDIELKWNESDPFRPERKAIYRAQILDAARQGQGERVKALLARARDSVPDKAVWDRLESETAAVAKPGKEGTVFYPWLRLTGAELDPDRGCRVRFEVLKDDPPPLKVTLYRKQFLRYGRVREMALDTAGRNKGAEVSVVIPVPKGVPLKDLAIRVMTDVQWVPGQLHVEGVDDDRVPL